MNAFKLSVFALFVAATSGLGVEPRADETVCYGDLGCFTTASPWTSSVRPLYAPPSKNKLLARAKVLTAVALTYQKDKAKCWNRAILLQFYSTRYISRSALPEDPAVINTRFLLNTRTNPTESVSLVTNDADGLLASPYDSAKRTVFLIHGWTNDANHNWVISSVREILTNDDVNVIRVDWGPGAGIPYLRALTNAQVVGAEIAAFISFVSTTLRLDPSQVHLIGHDLGAHVASYSGQRIPGIGRITALDPSAIYFEGADPLVRLDPSDAVLVDVVHTDAPHSQLGLDHIGLGFASSLGHVDIYVNNGQHQPGCDDKIHDLVFTVDGLVTTTDLQGPIDPYVCSHMRSVEYFVEAINSACPFTAFYCSSWEYFQKDVCFSSCPAGSKSCTALGYHAGKYPGRGNFYMDTQPDAPFCNEVIRVEATISTAQPKTSGNLNYILIGEVGQSKEHTLHSGSMSPGAAYYIFLKIAGSNALRLGRVEAVRMLYSKDLFEEDQLIVQTVVVQQANHTIEATDIVFKGAILSSGDYITLSP